ncbi:MAG: radical SAM protein [Planctomycetaceae bacterium]|jgi:nitrogen fixation protein NifB|nr:radical SAM protein [Planctomycetaceae bacterium]
MSYIQADKQQPVSKYHCVKDRNSKPSLNHPCFNNKSHNKFGRIHLPVSYDCNIQCRFCVRSRNDYETRPGVTRKILSPIQSLGIIDRALRLCPEITVVGIAGPGDTLANDAALDTFFLIHQKYPQLIKCLSTNGLNLPDYIDRLHNAGVQTITVTINAVDPEIISKIVRHILWDKKKISGVAMGKILIGRQLTGVKLAAQLGMTIKVNTVLIPGINDSHIEEIAFTAKELGVSIYNIIPLIPQGEFKNTNPPDCNDLKKAKALATQYIDVFEHCKHCRADACGIPGVNDFSSQLYQEKMETFSHG